MTNQNNAAQAAAQILTYLGFAQAVSMEPAADPRRDHIQALIESALLSSLRAPVAGEARPAGWQNALRIVELPEVDEALANFCDDSTKENAVGLVLAVLGAAPQASEAYIYARDLAVTMWEKRFKLDAPEWKPCEDLIGVLTQIDNMVAGLVVPQASEAVPAGVINAARWAGFSFLRHADGSYTMQQLATATAQASEAIRAITFDGWLAKHCDSDDLTAYERELALDAWNAAHTVGPRSLSGIDADRLRAIASSGSQTAMSNALLNVARVLSAQPGAQRTGGSDA